MRAINVLAGGIALVLGLCSGSNAAVVIPIEGPAKALFSSKEPTMTMLFEAEKPAKATILFLPGGDGVVPLKEGMTESKNPFFLGIFGPLIKGGYNVVTVGTPYPIDHGRSATVSDDRLDRIESVVRFYRERLKAPIWLLGHSTGAGQVITFVNRSAENRQLLHGAIMSSSRHEHSFSSEVRLPTLFVHHRRDGCPNTQHSDATEIFGKYKQTNNSGSKFLTIEGGTGDSDNPCYNMKGHHMYNGAYQEVAEALERNLAQ